jgi:hypothetical protein
MDDMVAVKFCSYAGATVAPDRWYAEPGEQGPGPSPAVMYINVEDLSILGIGRQKHVSLRALQIDIVSSLSIDFCQHAGAHPLRHATKKVYIINKHCSWWAQQYVLYRLP